jgi:prepilin-type N-terminal cleavage/methylation domain-containing protein
MSYGFTLVEALLSMAIIGILAALSAPIYASFQTRNDVDTNTQTVAELLRRANTYARSVKNDNAWGVHVNGATATLFEGTSYAARDTTSDETTIMPSNLTASGLTEVVFAKASGLTSNTGTITITAANTNDTKAITVNAKGMVAY